MSDDLQTFWMLWAPSGGAPTHRHATQADAYREAERLINRGIGPLYVLRSESRVTPPRRIVVQPMQSTRPDIMPQELLDDDLPF